MQKLTARQQEILDFIQQFMSENGFPPTRMEMADAMGFRSPNAAEDHLRALERKGAIEMLAGSSRGIRVLQQSRNKGVPVIVEVEKGSRVLDRGNISERVKLDSRLFQPRADFLLQVSGNTMRDAGILNGDMVAVHKANDASAGDIVVASYRDNVVVRRFRKRGQVVRLIPEGKGAKEVSVDLREEDLLIEGVVVGVVRAQL